MTLPQPILIADTEFLRIEKFSAQPGNTAVAITFTSRCRRELHGEGFGGEFLLRNGFDVIAFKLTEDSWYQDVTDAQIAAVSEAAAPYARRVTYGSSMGGYAAIRFAAPLSAHCALAFSPLFDIRWEQDPRYRDDRWAIRGPMMAAGMIAPDCNYVIAYDPSGADEHHAAAYADVIPKLNLTRIGLPYSGHPSGFFLLETGCLGEFVLSVLARGVTPPRRWRSQKGRSAIYLTTLAQRCLDMKWLRVARALNDRAAALQPGKPEHDVQRSRIALALGDIPAAVAAARQACLAAPNDLHIAAFTANLLLDVRLGAQARQIVDKLLSRAPNNPHYRHLLHRIDAAAGSKAA